jgi:8-oxo-dGTP pyrophosphatase MutT (NUDIX family)
MFKRDKRVQVVILQNGKYILLKHISKTDGRTFWTLPGGGKEENETEEEGAIREAFEETGLKIKLLPIKLESITANENSRYNSYVTFIGYPISGKAHLGYDPEPSCELMYRLIDIKWQDFYDDSGLDEFAKNKVEGVRQIFNKYSFIKKVCALIYKIEDGKVLFLLEENDYITNRYTIPEEKAEKDCSITNVCRQKYGVLCETDRKLGFNISENDNKFSLSEIYLCKFTGYFKMLESLKIRWICFEEIESVNISEEIKRFINEIYDVLMKKVKFVG